ncbi:hypothetical protein L195_g049539 [Trifolium pratense]|uniref:Uncharacterized protein n=1 Tax=Trifolium pratense TaxID=57577 RepID=A0A2K3JPG6_TRIPR|nr:hypothetical protein L195_g049539 [Trifolium pratense]
MIKTVLAAGICAPYPVSCASGASWGQATVLCASCPSSCAPCAGSSIYCCYVYCSAATGERKCRFQGFFINFEARY